MENTATFNIQSYVDKPYKQAMTSIRWACSSTKWQPSKSEWIRAAQCIQPEEKDRIGKFVFKRDAKSSMVGRLMLRRAIHHVTEIPYREIKLARTDKGKPYLVNHLSEELRRFSFNVSHQGDYVVLAAETECNVGIDVMQTDTPRAKSVQDFFHTMRKQFTAGEWQSIKSHELESDQLRTFYRLWCLKESYVKAFGIGIGFEVSRLDFNLADSVVPDQTTVCSTTLVLDGEVQNDWRFEETSIDDHSIAVATKRDRESAKDIQKSAEFTFLTVDELLDDMPCINEVNEEYGEKFMNRQESPGLSQNKEDTR